MTATELIKIAAKGYPDEYLLHYLESNGSGDILAEFVVTELRETHDDMARDYDQLATAKGIITSAIEDLEGVLATLDEEQDRIDDIEAREAAKGGA